MVALTIACIFVRLMREGESNGPINSLMDDFTVW